MTGRYNSIFGYDDVILVELMNPIMQTKKERMKTIRLVAGFLNKPIKNIGEKSGKEFDS